MKTSIQISKLVLLSTMVLVFQSCLKEKFEKINNQSDVSTYAGFEFNTVQQRDVEVKIMNNQNQPMGNVFLEIYLESPVDEWGIVKSGIEEKRIFQGITNEQGIFQCQVNPPVYCDYLYVRTKQIGVQEITKVPLTNANVQVQLGGSSTAKSTGNFNYTFANSKSLTPQMVNGYYTLGTWNTLGVPDYLESINDVITSDFLSNVTASLPEGVRLPISHPQYLASTQDVNLKIIENAEIWITFIHEGAGWLNVLGYYTYPTGNPPATKADISNLTIIFPNVSFLNSGGGLLSGNKVKLSYLDPITNQYTPIFPPGTSVGWFIIAQGWKSATHTVSSGTYTHYSDVQYNLEASESLRKHNVLLYDDVRQIYLLGFEDIRRDAGFGSDEDFNDAVFYATVSPVTAVDNNQYQPIDSPGDTDGDGVTDVFDQYPTDPKRAFNNYYPSQNVFGSLLFEDLWPYKGDYDFNDMVVDYNFNQVTNAQNSVTDIFSKIVVRAIGASYHNAFGIELNTSAGNVVSVSGQRNTKGYLNIAANGTESGQTKSSIIFFDDAFNALPYPGTGLCVNTFPENTFVNPDTMLVNILFNIPVAVTQIQTPPYNPFIIINRNRGNEVHLPNKAPTSLANTAMLGTGQDNSIPGQSKYYVSNQYLPWAINIPESFDYPTEKKDITQTYLMFNSWATSKGLNYADWYTNKAGYRDNNNVYVRTK